MPIYPYNYYFKDNNKEDGFNTLLKTMAFAQEMKSNRLRDEYLKENMALNRIYKESLMKNQERDDLLAGQKQKADALNNKFSRHMSAYNFFAENGNQEGAQSVINAALKDSEIRDNFFGGVDNIKATINPKRGEHYISYIKDVKDNELGQGIPAGRYIHKLDMNTQQIVGVEPANREDTGLMGQFKQFQKLSPEEKEQFGKFANTKSFNTNTPSDDEVSSLGESVASGGLGIEQVPQRGGTRAKVVSYVNSKYPGFNFAESTANIKFKQNPNIFNAVVNINAVKPLLGELEDQFEKIKTTNAVPYNKMANWIKENTGNPDVVAFETKRNSVIFEVVRALQGTGQMSDARVKLELDNLKTAYSPAQMKAALNNLDDVLNSRLEAVKKVPYEPNKSKQTQRKPLESFEGN